MNLDLEYFEKILARQSMIDSSYLNAIADHVKPEFFEDKRIASYFEIVKDFYDRRKTLPTISEVKAYLTEPSMKEGFTKLLTSFKEIDKNLNKDELYEKTERFLKEKSVYNTLLKVASELSEGIVDTSKILMQFESSCNINLISDKGIELFCNADLLIDDILNVESCISTGWDWLDDALGGGYREMGKALYVFAGQANIGKSIFLGNAAINIAKQDKSVLVITLEMSEMMYARRMSSNLTGIPLREFESATDSLKRLLSKRKQDIPNGKIFIKEFPPSTVTTKQLEAFVKKFKESGEKVDAIVIDYINLLHTTVGSNSYERVKHICEQVRAMSYEFACPIISATQLNRSAYNTNNPGMEGLSESIGLAATADVILSIFQNDEDQEMDIIRLGMMKNRYGPRGMVQPMKIDYTTLTIEQSDEDSQSFENDDVSLLEKFSD